MAVRNPTSRWLVAVALAVAWGHAAVAKPPDLPATDPITCTPDQPAPPMATVPAAPGKALEGRPVQMVFPEVFLYEKSDSFEAPPLQRPIEEESRACRTFSRCLLFGVNPALVWLPAETFLGDEDVEMMVPPTEETWQSLLRRVRDVLGPMTPKSPNQGTSLPRSGPVVVFLSGPLAPATPTAEPMPKLKAEPMVPADVKMPAGYVCPYVRVAVARAYWRCGFFDYDGSITSSMLTGQNRLDVLHCREAAQAAFQRGEEFLREGQTEPAVACYEHVRLLDADAHLEELANRRLQQIAAEATAVACADESVVAPKTCHAEQAQEKPADDGFTCPYLKEKAAAEKKAPPPADLGEGSVLENLGKLEEAEDAYRRAEYLRRHGHTADACAVYEKVRELAPGSRYDEMATRELEALRAEMKKPAADAGEEQEVQPKPKTHTKKGKPRTPKTDAATTSRKAALLMELNRKFYKEGKYKEAEIVAAAALDLDPEYAPAAAALMLARSHLKIKDGSSREKGKGLEEKDKLIEKRLKEEVNLNYTDEPLESVLEDLSSWSGLNVVPDSAALDAEGISLKRPVTLKVEGISLKSALSLILMQCHLEFVVKDEVVQIVPLRRNNGLVVATYAVGDLMEQSCSKLEQDCKTADEMLIRLITDTISPSSWAEHGGPCTIEYKPDTHALVVRQTPDVQEQIEQLLTALRDLTFKQQAVKAEGQPEWQGEEQDAIGPARKPTPTIAEQVDRLLESCQAAFSKGDVSRAESLMRQALALDAAAVSAHPLVYKTGLFSQLREAVKAARAPRAMRQPELPPVHPNMLNGLDQVVQEAEQLRESGRHAPAVQAPAGGEEASEPASGGREVQLFLEVPDSPLTFTTESEPAVAPESPGPAAGGSSAVLDRVMGTLRSAACIEIGPKPETPGGRVHLQCGRFVFRADWDGTGHGSMSWGLILLGDNADPGD
jgi:tetratricopeptide (TPR) repeat protein